jgi:MerR family transcriptional regulator, light-induced transcriptional regulator
VGGGGGSGAVGLRIGELSRRTGVTPDLLRAWERRYAVLRPVRTPSGQRLYGAEDERRVRRMRQLMRSGYSAAVAARMATGEEAPPPVAPAVPPADRLAAEMAAALERLDAPAAHDVLDRLLSGHGIDAVVDGAVLPFLRELGERWERGEVTVAQEHFASELIAGRLRALTREWANGAGPLALLACPAGERHDLGLLCFGLALRSRGWRIAWLGADTPTVAIADAIERAAPVAVVLSTSMTLPFALEADELARLAPGRLLAVGGRGASAAVAERIGAELLGDDVVTGAQALTELVAA